MTTDLSAWANVDRIVHEPARLIILALLQPADHVDFLYLLRHSGLTKGNLSSHLARLEEAQYISIHKGFQGKVPRTTYRLTDAGRTALRDYLAQMKSTVQTFERHVLATR